MASMRKVKEGLEILMANGGKEVCPAHDALFAGGKQDVSEEDAAKLKKLGWFYDESEESWCLFT